jgi:hypothetical protein
MEILKFMAPELPIKTRKGDKMNTMNTCGNGHNQIYYYVENCPLCLVFDEMVTLEEENIDAQAEIDSLSGQIESLQEELDSFENEGITT